MVLRDSGAGVLGGRLTAPAALITSLSGAGGGGLWGNDDGPFDGGKLGHRTGAGSLKTPPAGRSSTPLRTSPASFPSPPCSTLFWETCPPRSCRPLAPDLWLSEVQRNDVRLQDQALSWGVGGRLIVVAAVLICPTASSASGGLLSTAGPGRSEVCHRRLVPWRATSALLDQNTWPNSARVCQKWQRLGEQLFGNFRLRRRRRPCTFELRPNYTTPRGSLDMRPGRTYSKNDRNRTCRSVR